MTQIEQVLIHDEVGYHQAALMLATPLQREFPALVMMLPHEVSDMGQGH
jgi:hypothetical protein